MLFAREDRDIGGADACGEWTLAELMLAEKGEWRRDIGGDDAYGEGGRSDEI